MKNSPLVSVVMPVYNGEKYLEGAVQSILAQSYEHFELLIIDDGSTDGSPMIIEDYRKLDTRVKLLRHTSNRGLIAALNTGLEATRGKYVARMDQDDISLPERFSCQVKYLEDCSEIGLLGCRVCHIDHEGNMLSIPPMFLDDLTIRWHILFQNPFYHSTVMLRKSVLDETGLRYDPARENAEDLDLWSRLLLYTKGENLSQILHQYRIHSGSMSERNTSAQREKAAEISSLAILRHFPNAPFQTGDVLQLSRAVLGVSKQAKLQRARLIYLYLSLWTEFLRRHYSEGGLEGIQQGVIAWAARMILYPPFQLGSIKAFRVLTKMERRWPLFLFMELPYFWSRR